VHEFEGNYYKREVAQTFDGLWHVWMYFGGSPSEADNQRIKITLGEDLQVLNVVYFSLIRSLVK